MLPSIKDAYNVLPIALLTANVGMLGVTTKQTLLQPLIIFIRSMALFITTGLE